MRGLHCVVVDIRDDKMQNAITLKFGAKGNHCSSKEFVCVSVITGHIQTILLMR